jgi:hypothetical protein
VRRATGRIVQLRRKLLLAARRAVRAFCGRHRKLVAPRRVSLWAPALLRWSRKQASVHGATSPHGLAATGSWTSHLHLHFSALGAARSLDRTQARGIAGCLARPSPLLLASQNAERSANYSLRRTRTAEEGGGLEWQWVRPNAAGLRDAIYVGPRPHASANVAGVDRATHAAIGSHALPASLRFRADPSFSGQSRVTMASRAPTAQAHLPPGRSLVRTLAPEPVEARAAQADVVGAIASRSHARRSAVSWSRWTPRGRLLLGIYAGQSIRVARTSVSSILRPPAMRSVVSMSFESSRLEYPAHAPTQTRTSGLQTWRSPKARAAAAPPSPRPQAFAMKRPVDLVWRTSRDTEAPRDTAHAATTTARSTFSARSTPAEMPASASRSIGKAVVCATALDPVLVDRLADDVIRRIDRRARIERERRGP